MFRTTKGMVNRRIICAAIFILIACLYVLLICIHEHIHIGYWSYSEAGYKLISDLTTHHDGFPAGKYNIISKSISCENYKRRLPNCLIIGISKCGTFGLLQFFSAHPKALRNRKYSEQNFFNGYKYNRGLEWYREKMPRSCPGQIVLEKTPSYFTVKEVPARVFHMNPNIRLLLIVRSPTRRTMSKYAKDKREAEKEGKSREFIPSFEDSWRKFTYNQHYDTYLKNWLQYFKLGKHIHIVDGDVMAKYPVPELNKVENFLNLEPYFTDEMFVYNATKGYYCLKQLNDIDCLHTKKGHSYQNISLAVIKEMNDYFQPSNQRFFNLIGKKFHWDYNQEFN